MSDQTKPTTLEGALARFTETLPEWTAALTFAGPKTETRFFHCTLEWDGDESSTDDSLVGEVRAFNHASPTEALNAAIDEALALIKEHAG